MTITRLRLLIIKTNVKRESEQIVRHLFEFKFTSLYVCLQQIGGTYT